MQIIGLAVLVSALGLIGCVGDGSVTPPPSPSSFGWVQSYVQSARPAAALEPSEYQRLSDEISLGEVLEASVAVQIRAVNPQAWSHIRSNDIYYFVSIGCSDVLAAADWLVGRLGSVDLTAAPALTQGIFIMMRRCGAAGDGNPAAVDAIANRFNAHMFSGEQAKAAVPRPAPTRQRCAAECVGAHDLRQRLRWTGGRGGRSRGEALAERRGGFGRDDRRQRCCVGVPGTD